jgi:hypothetical protein
MSGVVKQVAAEAEAAGVATAAVQAEVAAARKAAGADVATARGGCGAMCGACWARRWFWR